MYDPLNSLGLDHEVHKIFHRIYGFRKPVTIDCLIAFLEDLMFDPNFLRRVSSFAHPRSPVKKETPISNQTVEPSTAGPETRVDDLSNLLPEIERLHERMVEKRSLLYIYSSITPQEKEVASRVQARLKGMTDEQRKKGSFQDN